MKIGVCADYQKAVEIKKAGFDYIELPLNKVGLYTEQEFLQMVSTLEKVNLPVLAFSLLLPKTMKVIGKDYNQEELEKYLSVAFPRMISVGAKVVSFGSGKSRFVPEGMGYKEAFKELVDVTRLIVDIAGKYGITIAIEPLNKNETNLINTLTEGSALASLSGAELLADAFHIRKEAEPISHIALCSPIVHAHIATLDGRRYPIEKNDEVMEFIKALRDSGYKGNLSIEGKTDDFSQDGEKALKVLKECFEEA